MQKFDHIFHYTEDFTLEGGGVLHGFQLKYTTLGSLNSDRNNVIWICHALTGSSDFTDWWKDLFSERTPFDPREYFIICANVLGGCYGSTGPLSLNPKTGKPYFHQFPTLTNRDVVSAFDLLRQQLKINQVHTLLGGSLGGQQALEWAILQPTVFRNVIPIACNAFHSSWGIAFNEAQRMAIASDATWKENDERAGSEGMKAARAIAMLSFRTYETYGQTQVERNIDKLDDFRAASYQRYQGEKLAKRFNAYTYWLVTKLMDSHQVGRGRGSAKEALGRIKANVLVVGIDSDLLFPLEEQKFLADSIPNAQLTVISSLYGHDGFLVEFDVFKKTVRDFLKQEQEIKL
ncbi:MAG TPA: homoserine O-acetyltransferase [Cyclobacteriaceae bacterium]|jgi:homoserine O-acetyltransferase|nr:homoserine O-acetyltransferase [Cyclobacteriaceae bacterium]